VTLETDIISYDAIQRIDGLKNSIEMIN